MLSLPWVLLAVGVPSAFLTIRYVLSLIFALIVYLRDGREALKDVQPIIDAGARSTPSALRLPLPRQPVPATEPAAPVTPVPLP